MKHKEVRNFEIDGSGEKIDPWAREVTSSAGKSVVVDEEEYQWQCNDFVMPPWNELVIYQVHPCTFPDQIRRPIDQLYDVAEDLWYLKELGVNAIQLLPTSEFAGNISWGYNPSNIFAVESSYGGPSALKYLIDQAHSNGIAVLLDVVYNHLQADASIGLWQFTRWNENSLGGVFFYNDWRATTEGFGDNRPDFGRPEVRDFLRENALMWLNEYRVDGLRFDSVGNIRNVHDRDDDPGSDLADGWLLLRSINNSVNASQPWKIMIAEDLKSNAGITQGTDGDWQGGAGFDSQWEEKFYGAVCGALTRFQDMDRSIVQVASALKANFNGDAFQRVIYLENHDKVADKEARPGRLPDQIEPGNVDDGWYAKKLSTLGAVLLFTAPAIPMMHQGQELLEWRRFGDNPERNGVDWNRFCSKPDCATCHANYSCEPNGKFFGIFRLYRDVIKLRRNWFNCTRGLRGRHIHVFHVHEKNKVLAFHRWENGGPRDDVIVVANFADRTYSNYIIGLPREGHWRVRFNSNWTGYDSAAHDIATFDLDAISGDWDGLNFQGNLNIGPYAAIILSQD